MQICYVVKIYPQRKYLYRETGNYTINDLIIINCTTVVAYYGKTCLTADQDRKSMTLEP